MTDVDDGVRGEFGLVVSVKDRGPLGMRLVFDRVQRDGQGWRSRAFVTVKDFTRAELLEMSMSEEDLASIGLVLAAELCASLESRE